MATLLFHKVGTTSALQYLYNQNVLFSTLLSTFQSKKSLDSHTVLARKAFCKTLISVPVFHYFLPQIFHHVTYVGRALLIPTLGLGVHLVMRQRSSQGESLMGTPNEGEEGDWEPS